MWWQRRWIEKRWQNVRWMMIPTAAHKWHRVYLTLSIQSETLRSEAYPKWMCNTFRAPCTHSFSASATERTTTTTQCLKGKYARLAYRRQQIEHVTRLCTYTPHSQGAICTVLLAKRQSACCLHAAYVARMQSLVRAARATVQILECVLCAHALVCCRNAEK